MDKVLAVFGRAEARDFVDPMAVERRYGLDRLCQLAVVEQNVRTYSSHREQRITVTAR